MRRCLSCGVAGYITLVPYLVIVASSLVHPPRRLQPQGASAAKAPGRLTCYVVRLLYSTCTQVPPCAAAVVGTTAASFPRRALHEAFLAILISAFLLISWRKSPCILCSCTTYRTRTFTVPEHRHTHGIRVTGHRSLGLILTSDCSRLTKVLRSQGTSTYFCRGT